MLSVLGGNGLAHTVASMDLVLYRGSFVVGMWIAFDWDSEGFSCSNTVAKRNLSIFLSHEYHHAYSLQLRNRKEGSKQHFLGSIEEAYYLVEDMLFVSFFPHRGFGVLVFWRK
jgi:hypothetical protein